MEQVEQQGGGGANNNAGEGGNSYGGLSGLMGRVLGGAASGAAGVSLSSEFFVHGNVILY